MAPSLVSLARREGRNPDTLFSFPLVIRAAVDAGLYDIVLALELVLVRVLELDRLVRVVHDVGSIAGLEGGAVLRGCSGAFEVRHGANNGPEQAVDYGEDRWSVREDDNIIYT
jgi:hypothetical protein